MSKRQRDAIDAALRAEPFGLSQSTAEHRKSFEAFNSTTCAYSPSPAQDRTERSEKCSESPRLD